jgi:predicted MFS family arabinose efflux permease
MTDRKMVVVLAISAFVGMTSIVSFDLMMPGIADDLGVSVAALAQISFVMYVLGATIGLLLGPLADHYGLRRTMMFGGVLLAFSCIASALAVSFWMLLLSRLPVGIGIMGAVSIAIASTRLPEENRRRGMGWIMTTVPLAAILGSPALGMIAHYASWRLSYIALAMVFLTIALLVWRFVPADPAWPDTRFEASGVLKAYGPILRDRLTVFLYISDALRGTSTWLLFIFLSAFLVRVHGLSLQQVSMVYTAIGISYVVGTRFGNGDFQRFSLPTLYAGSTLGLIPFAVLVLSGNLGLTVSIPALLALMFLGGVGFPAMTIMISEASRGGQGTTMMLRRSLFSASQALAASTGGAMLAIGGFGLLGVGVGVFGLLSVAVAVAASRIQPFVPPQPAAAGE